MPGRKRVGACWVVNLRDEEGEALALFSMKEDAYIYAADRLVEDCLGSLCEAIVLDSGEAKWLEVFEMHLRPAYENKEYEEFLALFYEWCDRSLHEPGLHINVHPCDIDELKHDGRKDPPRLANPFEGDAVEAPPSGRNID
jgi:hypothetical protein